MSERKPRAFEILGATLSTIAILGATACTASTKELNSKPNTAVRCLQLENGAVIRSYPMPGDSETSTKVLQVDFNKNSNYYVQDKTVYVTTPNGVEVLKNTTNGTWYGVPKMLLEPRFTSPEDQAALNSAPVVVWVNESRADVSKKECIDQKK